MEEQDAVLDYLCPGLTPEESVEANHIYELMLTMGADAGVAKGKVAELYSPPWVTEYIGSLPSVLLEPGSTFDLRQGADGKKWNLLLAGDRAKARALIAKERPFIVIGSRPCIDFSVWNTRLNHKRMSPLEV
jgi:hypothetical protein